MRDIEAYVEDYIEKNSFEKYQVKFRRRKTLQFLKTIDEKSSLLEIGCGMEPLFLHIDSFQKYVLVEPGSEFYCNALEKSKNDERILCIQKFLEDSLEELKHYKFDYIICDGLLHEVSDPARLLQTIKALCTEQTQIHISVPNAKSFHRLLAKESGIIANVYQKSNNNILFQQHTVFDMQTLVELVSSIGQCCVIEKGSYFIKLFTHEQMLRCINEKIIDIDVLEGLNNMEKYMPDLGSEIFLDFKWI